MLDKKTMRPLKYSNIFHFGIETGIEFCIGFSIIDLKYQFWISQLDSNPLNVSVSMSDLPFLFDVI